LSPKLRKHYKIDKTDKTDKIECMQNQLYMLSLQLHKTSTSKE